MNVQTFFLQNSRSFSPRAFGALQLPLTMKDNIKICSKMCVCATLRANWNQVILGIKLCRNIYIQIVGGYWGSKKVQEPFHNLRNQFKESAPLCCPFHSCKPTKGEKTGGFASLCSVPSTWGWSQYIHVVRMRLYRLGFRDFVMKYASTYKYTHTQTLTLDCWPKTHFVRQNGENCWQKVVRRGDNFIIHMI